MNLSKRIGSGRRNCFCLPISKRLQLGQLEHFSVDSHVTCTPESTGNGSSLSIDIEAPVPHVRANRKCSADQARCRSCKCHGKQALPINNLADLDFPTPTESLQNHPLSNPEHISSRSIYQLDFCSFERAASASAYSPETSLSQDLSTSDSRHSSY